MAIVNIYLNFKGNCEAAFNYYKSVFGSEFTYMGKFKEMPPQEGMPPMSKEMGEQIMHVSLPISKETSLLGSDVGDEYASQHKQGNNFSVSVSAESTDEATRIFNQLSAGGIVTMPLGQTFWSECFGMCTDKFGINWMVGYSENPM